MDVRELAALGVLCIGQQPGGGGMGLTQPVRAPGLQAGGSQVLQQLALAQGTVKLPVGPQAHGAGEGAALAQHLQLLLKALGHAGAVDHLARGHAAQPVGQLVLGALGQVHAALRHAQPRQAAARTRALVHGQQHGFGFVGKQLGVRQRAGGDHTHHLALHRAFGGAHLAHLLGNGHRFAHLDEARQVVL